MKLTYEQKLKTYKEWDEGCKSPGTITKELGVDKAYVEFFDYRIFRCRCPFKVAFLNKCRTTQ